jgi:hypothetical protein
MSEAPTVKWCGEDHPHAAHDYRVESPGTVQITAIMQCSGSTGRQMVGPCANQMWEVIRGLAPPTCTLGAGHSGAHTDGSAIWWREVEAATG